MKRGIEQLRFFWLSGIQSEISLAPTVYDPSRALGTISSCRATDFPYSEKTVMKGVLAALLLSALAGCASVPLLIREPPADNPTLADVQTNPTTFMNRRVRWGGIIVSARNIENRAEVEILAKALGDDGRPEPGDVSLGRFLVNSDGFLDPALYSVGREVTVYGVLQNVLVRNIGTHPYLYPLVNAAQLYVWTEQR